MRTILAWFFLCGICFGQTPIQWENGRYLAQSKYGEIVVHAASPVIYKMSDRPAFVGDFVKVYRFDGKSDYSTYTSFKKAQVTDGFFEHQGNVVKVTMQEEKSDAKTIPPQISERSFCVFNQSGKQVLTLNVGEESIPFEVDVIDIGLNEGSQLADFVE